MANLVEVAQRVPTAVAEVTGQKLSGVIDNVKDTLNPKNFFQAAGSILTQEAPILGSIGGVVGDLTSSLMSGASPEEATELNTEEISLNTEKNNSKLDDLTNAQIQTTEALLGNNNVLKNISDNQAASEFKDLENQREGQRLQEDGITVQEETKEENTVLQAIMESVSGGITGLLDFFKGGFTGILGKLLKGVVGAGGGLASGAAKAATGIGGLATKGIAAAGGLLPAAGIAVAGASLVSGLFSGVTAGLEEYEKSGDLSSAIKEGGAGFISGATFGLISQETVSETFDAIGSFASDTFGGLKDMAGDAFTGLENTFGDFSVFKFITGTIGDAVDSIKNIFSGDFSLENFGSLFGSLTDIVYAPVNLAVNAVKDIFSLGDPEEPFSLSEFISGLITDIYNMIADYLPDVDDITSALPSLSDLTFGLLGGDEPEPQATPKVAAESTEPTVSVMMKDGSFQDLTREEIQQGRKDGTIDLDFARRALRKLPKKDQSSKIKSADDPNATRADAFARESGATQETPTQPAQPAQEVAAESTEPTVRVRTNEGFKDLTREEIEQGRDDGTIDRDFARNALRKLPKKDQSSKIRSADDPNATRADAFARESGAQAQAQPPVQRTAEMVGTQSALADTERTQTGGGNNVVNAPQVNNNVTNNNMGSQQPTPKNQDSTLDRYGSSEMAFIGT